MMRTIIALTLLASAFSDVPSLTEETYYSATSGKIVFIKYFTTWCQHCKDMVEDWKKLAIVWESVEEVFIAEVDCGGDESISLCGKERIRGYPTLKYGTDMENLLEYEGERNFEDLQEFARHDAFRSICNIHNVEVCSTKQRDAILSFQTMSIVELQTLIDNVDQTVSRIEKMYRRDVKDIDFLREGAQMEKLDAVRIAKYDSNYFAANIVLAFKKETVVAAAAAASNN